MRHIIAATLLTLLALLIAMGLVGCGETKYVPEIVTLPLAQKPIECSRKEHRNLHALPEIKPKESVEQYVARIGAVHRMNITRYRYTWRNKMVCRKYVEQI